MINISRNKRSAMMLTLRQYRIIKLFLSEISKVIGKLMFKIIQK